MSGVGKMKVAELREALEARGLDTRGTKPFLISRLEDAISKDTVVEVEEKGRLKELKEKILAEAPPAAVAAAAPSTPGRRSRRLSGEYAALAAGGTPARRRLLDSVTGSPSRIGSPARKTRRLSGGGDDRPSTPSRRSRRLSGCSADGEEEEQAPGPVIPDPIEEVEEEEAIDQGKADSEVVKKIESEGAEVATELDTKAEEGGKVEKEEEKTLKDTEKMETVTPEESKSNVVELKEVESEQEGEMEVEQVDEKVQIESEKSKMEQNTSEGESEKENVSAEDKVTAKDSTNDDSFSTAASAVIGSTNALITSLRQEMASRNSLVAPKQIPRQKPKSGKFWKEGRSAFRSLKKDKGQRLTFDQRLAMKEEKVRNRDLAKTLLEQKNLKKEEMRKKIEENKTKKLENERKAEQFQVIKNPAKIKRMKKKQLRQLEKRDILAAK